MTKDTKRKLDELARALKRTDPERIRSLMVKTERIQLRCSASDRAGIVRMAKLCNLTLTEYLLRMHYLIEEILSKGKGR